MARSHGLVKWLMQMAHDQEVVGLNPGMVYQMNVCNNASYYIKIKIKNKSSQLGHTKKKYL